MAACLCPPIKEPVFYIPDMKVTVYKSFPTHLGSIGSGAVFYQSSGSSGSRTTALSRELSMASRPSLNGSAFGLLLSLEVLCHSESRSAMFLRTNQPSRFFLGETSVMVSQLRDIQSQLSVVEMTTNHSTFPLATFFIKNGKLPAADRLMKSDTSSHLLGYMKKMASVHQLMCISGQINNDITALRSHKYVPHQTALLHERLAEHGLNSPFYHYKALIEERFESMKTRLSKNDNILINNHQEWLLELTGDLVEFAESFPAEVNDRVRDLHTLLH